MNPDHCDEGFLEMEILGDDMTLVPIKKLISTLPIAQGDCLYRDKPLNPPNKALCSYDSERA